MVRERERESEDEGCEGGQKRGHAKGGNKEASVTPKGCKLEFELTLKDEVTNDAKPRRVDSPLILVRTECGRPDGCSARDDSCVPVWVSFRDQSSPCATLIDSALLAFFTPHFIIIPTTMSDESRYV